MQLEHHRADLLRRGPAEGSVVDRAVVGVVAGTPAAAAAYADAGAQIDRDRHSPRLLLEAVERRRHHPAVVHHHGPGWGTTRGRRGGATDPADASPAPSGAAEVCRSEKTEVRVFQRWARLCGLFIEKNATPSHGTSIKTKHPPLRSTWRSGCLQRVEQYAVDNKCEMWEYHAEEYAEHLR